PRWAALLAGRRPREYRYRYWGDGVGYAGSGGCRGDELVARRGSCHQIGVVGDGESLVLGTAARDEVHAGGCAWFQSRDGNSTAWVVAVDRDLHAPVSNWTC